MKTIQQELAIKCQQSLNTNKALASQHLDKAREQIQQLHRVEEQILEGLQAATNELNQTMQEHVDENFDFKKDHKVDLQTGDIIWPPQDL